jgi:predicted MFS family arabinose efflux permease
MSRYKIQAFLFVFVAFMLGCNEYMIVGVLPDISREINASLSSLGYLVTVFALVYAIATPLVTSLTKYFKRHQLLLFLMGIFFIGNTWTALSHSYVSLLLSRILSATTAGAIISLILVIANFVAPLEKKPRFSPGFLPASRLLPSSACQSGPLSFYWCYKKYGRMCA